MIDSKLFCVREKNVGLASFSSTKARRAVKSADQLSTASMLGERVAAFIRANGLYEWGESDLDRMPPLPSASPRPPLRQAHTQALTAITKQSSKPNNLQVMTFVAPGLYLGTRDHAYNKVDGGTEGRVAGSAGKGALDSARITHIVNCASKHVEFARHHLPAYSLRSYGDMLSLPAYDNAVRTALARAE